MSAKKLYLGLHAHPTRKIAFEFYQGNNPRYVVDLAKGNPAKLYVLESVAKFTEKRSCKRYKRKEAKAKVGAYMCFVPTREAPRYFHGSFAEAATEANRLLSLGNSSVLLMKVIKIVEPRKLGMKHAA